MADPLRNLLKRVRPRLSDRRLRLFACACLRQAWHLLAEDWGRRTVEVAERHADGRACAGELVGAMAASWDAFADQGFLWLARAAWGATRKNARATAALVADDVAEDLAGPQHRKAGRAAWEAVRARQEALLLDIAGPPAPVVRGAEVSGWLAWRGRTIARLARAAYEERDPSSGLLDTARLAVLADALEEAGCDNAEVLAHLRGPGPHMRGCRVVDLLTRKK